MRVCIGALISLLLLTASPSWAALSVGVKTSIEVNTTTTGTTTGIATTTGSGLLVGIVFTNTASFTSLTDSVGNGAPIQIGAEQTVTGGKTRLYYWPNITGGAAHTVTLTITGATQKSIFVQEVKTTIGSGITLDQNASGVDATTPFTSPAITTLIADEMLVAFDADDVSATTTHTAGASFTLQTEQTSNTGWTGALGTQLVAATGTYNSSWTVSSTPIDTAQWIASFSEAGVCRGALLLMGVGGC